MGALLAVYIAGSVQAHVGPFDATVSVQPSWSGHTVIRLAPLGSIELDTHNAPVLVEVSVDELRRADAEEIAQNPNVLRSLEDDIAADARRALLAVALRGVVVATLGACAGAYVARSRLRSVALGAAAGAIFATVLVAATVTTFDAEAVAEPKYSGLLTVAPTAVGDLEAVVGQVGEYRAQLTDLVSNVVTLYRTVQGLPILEASDETVRVLHVSDIHLNPQAFDLIDLLIQQFDIDAVIDTGDITDWGSEPEARFVERISKVGVPYVYVRGNHDSAATQQAVAAQPNAIVLDGNAATVAGLRLWGAADTRFTPNKDQPSGKEREKEQAEAFAPKLERLLDRDPGPPVDAVLVHDARMAARIGGRVPLVLSGHTHNAKETNLGQTRVLVEGSTGGGGLRSVQGDRPQPLASTILYFNAKTSRLVAYDRVIVRGLGESGARIERHVPKSLRDEN